MQMHAASLLRPLALTASLAMLALGACTTEPEIVYECQPGFVCFPEGQVPDTLGGGDGTTGTPDSSGTPDTGGNEDSSSGPDTVVADTGGPGDAGTGDAPVEDIVIEPGAFGAPCNTNGDCNSGWCVEGQGGYICTKTCVEECPDGFDCKSISSGGGDLVFLCAPRIKKLCTPCSDDSQCTDGGCLTIDGSRQCSYSCTTDEDCPGGFGCIADPDPDHTGNYCVPNSGSCTCTPVFNGGQRSCEVTNGLGTCFGVETCEPETGWSGCSAAPATDELCDGLDNDCDGFIDEDLPESQPCLNTVDGVGSCAGTEVCFGPAGWVCQAATPEVETCDFKDNDCDGDTDEDFKVDDQYASNEHCGTCNASCDFGFPNAAETSCGLFGGSPQCKVDTCEQGFSKINDFQCVPNVASICQPCATDDNCLGDGAACISLAEGTFCSQACSGPTDCPSGYDCQDVGATENQCVPTSGSCSCDGTNTDLSRACSVTFTPPDPQQPAYTCNGFEQCTSNGWGACGLPTEECDNVDNDCDGEIDEDFKTPSGQYLLVEHCGGCGISCLALSPQFADPICDTSTGVAQCGFECQDGYFNVNGLADDGCECSPTGTDDLAGDGVDSNCDGIDGEVDNGVFVAKNGDDLNVGTIDSPLLTIDEAIARAVSYGVRDVYVATGVYSESIVLEDGIGVFGGYSSDFLERDILLFETAIVGQDGTPVAPGAVSAIDVGASGAAASTILDGFTIFGANAANTAGANSYAIYVRNGGSNLEIRNNRVFGGAGGAGGTGFKGNDGADGVGGTAGQAAYDVNKFTGSNSRSCTNGADGIDGGAGGGLTCGSTNVSGGAGGAARCPNYNAAPPSASDGDAGQGSSGGGGGDGGYGAQIDTGSDCGFCAVPDNGPMAGGLGLGGQAGADGAAGGGCAQPNGQVVNGHWEGVAGGGGGNGLNGSGGGGGGAGGGVDVIDQQCIGSSALDPDIDGIDVGGSGGGGGSGGCAGTSGSGGSAGGGSFGIFIVFDSSAAEVPVVSGNTVRRGSGGAGGGAGGGGAGGVGGSGAAGGASGEGDFTTFCARGGASGGDGGQGGHGGGGGGGCGGASYGIYVDTAGGSASFDNYSADNGFIPGGQGGVGGAGGSSPGNSGTPGQQGASADTNF